MRMDTRQKEYNIKHYSEEELAPIIRTVCTTLSFVHAAGWAHRGLNISVREIDHDAWQGTSAIDPNDMTLFVTSKTGHDRFY